MRVTSQHGPLLLARNQECRRRFYPRVSPRGRNMATQRKPSKRAQAKERLKVTTCLTFSDRAEEAVRFYVSAFKDSEILGMVRSEADGPIPRG